MIEISKSKADLPLAPKNVSSSCGFPAPAASLLVNAWHQLSQSSKLCSQEQIALPIEVDPLCSLERDLHPSRVRAWRNNQVVFHPATVVMKYQIDAGINATVANPGEMWDIGLPS